MDALYTSMMMKSLDHKSRAIFEIKGAIRESIRTTSRLAPTGSETSICIIFFLHSLPCNKKPPWYQNTKNGVFFP